MLSNFKKRGNRSNKKGPIVLPPKKYIPLEYAKLNENTKFHFVFFITEGYPNDNGMDLKHTRKEIVKKSFKKFDKVSIFTPRALKNLGFDTYIKSFDDVGECYNKEGINKVGFGAWKPLIIYNELENMNDGDILIYRDASDSKTKSISTFDNIKEIASLCLDICKFDFFIPRKSELDDKSKLYVKNIIIKELGINPEFIKDFPFLSCGSFSVFKKTEKTMEFLGEWMKACQNIKWLDGNKYIENVPEFKYSKNSESIMNVIISNWIFNKKYEISPYYPRLIIENNDFQKIHFSSYYDHIKYLNIKK